MTAQQEADALRQLGAQAAPNPIERVRMQITERRQVVLYPGATPVWVTTPGKWELF